MLSKTDERTRESPFSLNITQLSEPTRDEEMEFEEEKINIQ